MILPSDWPKVLEVLKPPPKLTVSEWADTNRRLSQKASSEPGQWRTDRAPYQRGIMDAFNEPHVTEVVVMSAAQVGKTEFFLNVIGFHIDHDPAPILVLQPTLDMGSKFSKHRLSTMIRDTPVLRTKVAESKAKTGGNTILLKDFPGGHLTISGANSPASLASMPIRIVLLDEVDRYPHSAGAEGSPVSLAVKRTDTFWNRKIGKVATPTVKGHSAIEDAYELSDQRRYYVPCPHCEHEQVLVWEQIKFKDNDPETAHYECVSCERAIHESDKYLMLRRGEWRPSQPTKKIAGFHISSLYSPWLTWSKVVEEFLAAKGNFEKMKVWTNTALGETFDEEGEKLDHQTLYARREFYKAPVPAWVAALTCGIDTQDDRFEISVYGHGPSRVKERPGIEHALIMHKILRGDTSKAELYRILDEFLLRTFAHELGVQMRISAVGMDAGGHQTEMVYRFCNARAERHIYALLGANKPAQPLVSRERKGGKYDARYHMVGTDTAKAMITSDLKADAPGGGFIHFPMEEPNVDEEFFKQLTAEKKILTYKKGRPLYVWKSTRNRNEAIDCAVYDRAALQLLNPDYRRILALIRRAVAPMPEPDDTNLEPGAGVRRQTKVAKKRRKSKNGRNRNRNFARNY